MPKRPKDGQRRLTVSTTLAPAELELLKGLHAGQHANWSQFLAKLLLLGAVRYMNQSAKPAKDKEEFASVLASIAAESSTD